jgi:hypothetical protein
MRLATVLRAGAALAVAAGAALTGLGPMSAAASSHREAPLIAADPAVDNTDLYAFVSPERAGYVTFVANWQPFSDPDGGPNFFPFATDAAYLVNVDSDGDAKPDAVFRWTFQNVDKRGGDTFLYANGPVTTLDDENLLFRQTYTLESSFHGEPFKTRISGAPVAPSRVGQATMPDYAKLRNDANKRLPGGWNVYAGQADDPFFLDLRVFDLLYGGDLSEVGRDTLKGYNVNTIALQVPFTDVALKGDPARNPVIGVWTTTERAKTRITGSMSTGDIRNSERVQVSRLGNPLVNEVVIPASLKDAFNAIGPDQDAGIPAVVQRVTDPELPKLIEGIYKVPAPATPRTDLTEIFLTGITTKAGGPIKADLNSQLNNADVNAANFRPAEMLRLNLSVPVTAQPNRLGVLGGDLQGFPNGRRLADDVVDISVQAVEGAAVTGKLVDALAAGDKVDTNDNAFGGTFPYVALPNTTKATATAQSGSGASAAPSASATPGGVNAKPSAFESGDGMTAVTVGTSALAAGLGATLFTGWWRRRRSPLS